jgi:tRNA uridine 5-carboxymethylaminomethyl modification enzyme
MQAYPESIVNYGEEVNFQIELNLKYAGYIERQQQEVAKLAHVENLTIPPGLDYSTVSGLRNEARQKLAMFNPATVGQAQRISGVSPADISILMISLKRYQIESKSS